MLEQGSGHIVNVGSVAGRRPFPGGSVYAATKFAVRALSWGLHLELGASHGIRVTDIQPGMVDTELTDHIADESLREGFKSAWKDRRALKPEDIARSVLFAVASPEHMSVSEILVRPTDQPTRFRGSTRSAEGASGRSAGRPFFGDALVRSLVASSTGRRWVGPAPLRSRSR